MATRNFPYGISPSLPFIIDLFSASPYRNIIVETAGIGQGDVSIKSFSHLTLVLLSPSFRGWNSILKRWSLWK